MDQLLTRFKCATSTYRSTSAIPISARQKEVDRPAATWVGRQLAARIPHRLSSVPECGARAGMPEIGFGQLWLEPAPNRLERGPRFREVGGNAVLDQMMAPTGRAANTQGPMRTACGRSWP